MTADEILDRVLAFFTERFPKEARGLTASTDLKQRLLLDSLAIVEVVMFLEASFDLTLDRSDLAAFGSPQAIADLVVRKQQRSRA